MGKVQHRSGWNSHKTPWLCFYQTRSAWSMDQGSNKNHSPAYHFAPTVTKFCVMWEGLSLPHDTKFGNCRCEIVDSRAFPSWSLIHGLRWSGLIKAEPGWHLHLRVTGYSFHATKRKLMLLVYCWYSTNAQRGDFHNGYRQYFPPGSFCMKCVNIWYFCIARILTIRTKSQLCVCC